MNRSIHSLSTRLVPLGVFLTLAVAFVWLWRQAAAQQSRSLAKETELLVDQTALQLEEIGKRAAEVAYTMRTAWRGGAATFARFDEQAVSLQARYPELLAINWVGPGGVIHHVFPKNEANAQAWGKDLDGNTAAGPYLALARENEEVVFTGPLELYQGRIGVASYLRIQNRHADGFINVVFSLDGMVSRLGEPTLDAYDYALLCKSGGAAGEPIWYGPQGLGDSSLLDHPYQQAGEFRLAPNSWDLVLAPKPAHLRMGTSVEQDLFLAAGLALALALALVVRRELLSRAKLANSERRYRHIVHDLPDLVCRYRTDGTITFANEAFAERYGRTAADLVGDSLFELYPPEQWDELRQHITALEPGDPIESYRYSEGENSTRPRWERWRERALLDPSGGVREVQSIGYDVTDAREAEEQLRHSQERYRTLVESSPDGVVIHRDGRILYANDSLAELVGAEETWRLPGLPVADLLPPHRRARGAADAERNPARGSQVRSDDGQVRHMDGHLIDVEVISSRIMFDGQPAQQAILRDVTDRRRAENALRESEERFRTIFSSISDGVLIHDRNGALLEVNESACALFGLSHDLLCRIDAGALVADGDALVVEALRAHFAAARETGEPQLFEFRARRGRGEPWWAEVSLRAARIAGRERLLAVVRDVTGRREAQEALSVARNRLDHLLSTSPTVIYSRTPGIGSRFTFISRSLSQLIGLEPGDLLEDRSRMRAVIHAGDRLRVDAQLAEADARGDRFTCEYRLVARDGSELWIQDDARLLRDAEGRPVEWVGSWRDVSSSKRIENSQQLMMGELDHRVNDTLATVLSLLDQVEVDEDFQEDFRGRIEALAQAHEALARESWELVDLEHISSLVLEAEVQAGHTSVAGPTLTVEARMATPLALALHELASNAAKHGALSTRDGRAELTWAEEERGLVLTWREVGGPAPRSASTAGADLELVRGLIEHELGGSVTLELQGSGLQVQIVLPVADVAAKPGLLV